MTKKTECITTMPRRIKKRKCELIHKCILCGIRFISSEKREHINKHIVDVIKIQSIIKTRYWLIPYIRRITPLIDELYHRKNKTYVHEPTIFGDSSIENITQLEIAFKQKQKQMKEGELTQIIIGNWFGWEDLGVGHSSGLDCRKKDNSIIIELKNKWNTCNSGSKKSVMDKLSKYKKENPHTRCVWGIVNAKPGCKKLQEKIIHDGVEIEKIQGLELFKLVFSIGKMDYSSQIINMVKDYIAKY